MTFHSLEEIVGIARSGSRFYSRLYKNLPLHGFRLEDLPVALFEDVMAAVHADFRALFSSEAAYGICYTTSGTTGRPKATLFGREEWRTVNQVLSNTHWKNGLLVDGDVVCNVSEPGSASFMAIHGVVNAFPGRCSEIPVGCDTDYSNIVRVLREFRGNVIAGMTPTLLGLAETVLATGEPLPQVERLLGGGELMYGAQPALLREAFPRAVFCPFMYGATEAGMIGFSDFSLRPNEIRTFENVCRVEIVDPESRKPILERGMRGLVVVTSFVRTAAPAIRLETGDWGQWEDDPSQASPRFSLHGRRFPFVRSFAGLQWNEDDVWKLIRILEPKLALLRLQLRLLVEEGGPLVELVLSLHGQEPAPRTLEGLLEDALATTMPPLSEGMRREIRVRSRVVPHAHFVRQTRRKSRLIVEG